MAVISVRNLPEDVHRALKVRAARHGRSTEAEIRKILEDTVHAQAPIKIGSALAALGQSVGGVDLDIRRDPTPTEPAILE
jgi:plasmid stability protein